MFTLDANVFARTLHASQPDHAACQALLEVIERRALPVFVPTVLLAEVAATVRRTTGDAIRARLFADALRNVAGITFVAVDAPIGWTAAELAADEALRGMDAIYVAVARVHSCTLISLDAEARTRAARVVAVATPTEVLARLNIPL